MMENDDLFHFAINAKLADIAQAAVAKPAWHDARAKLDGGCTEEDRLSVYQAIRDSGCLPEVAGFFLVAWQIDAMSAQRAEKELRPLEERLDALGQPYSFGNDDAETDGAESEDYDEALQEYESAWSVLFKQMLRDFGEHAIADLYDADPDEYHRRFEVGRQFFHGDGASDAPGWLADLAESVAAQMTGESPSGPLGFRYSDEGDGFWEINIYPTPVELIGGPDDGEIVDPGYHLDLEGLRCCFDKIVDFGWDPLGLNTPEGPRIWLEGVYQHHDVFLQILATAPADEEPGLKIDAARRRR